MKKMSSILTVGMFILVVSLQTFAQYRDIAVVGHNQNHPNAIAASAPNTSFSGWNGGTSTFIINTTSPPRSYLKNKLNGAHLANCQVDLVISNVQTFANWNTWGNSGDLLLNGNGSFKVTCAGTPATVLNGSFSQSILHVSAGSTSASLTLLNNSLNYTASSNLINNLPGNYSFFEGNLSIGITTADPMVLDPATNSVSAFKGFSNITFGARKI